MHILSASFRCLFGSDSMSAFLRHPTIQKLVENTKKFLATDSTAPKERRVVSLEELREHDGRDGGGGWVAICGMVYDLEPFFDGRSRHPGGPKILTKHLGTDATDLFMQFHYPRGKAVTMAPGMFVGVLEEVGSRSR